MKVDTKDIGVCFLLLGLAWCTLGFNSGLTYKNDCDNRKDKKQLVLRLTVFSPTIGLVSQAFAVVCFIQARLLLLQVQEMVELFELKQKGQLPRHFYTGYQMLLLTEVSTDSASLLRRCNLENRNFID